MSGDDSRQSDAERFAARGFGVTLGFGERPALLVVDMLRAFTDPARPLGASLDAEIAATSRLLACARATGVPVFFSVVRYEANDLADAGLWAIKVKGSTSLRAGTDGVEIDPRLEPRSTESIVVKKYASCFFGTDLLSRLVNRRIDTLVLAGCTTSGCVRATAVDALQNGFRPMVVREAVGDRSRAAHDQSLFDLQAKYADVVALDDALAHLGAPR